jgi:flagellar motor protein MotB
MAVTGKAVSSLTTTWWDEGREKQIAARVTTKGWGSEQAVGDNATDDGRALNRGVEIVLN